MISQYTTYVVIVTFNAMKWLERCLSTLHASDIPLNVIIVDNGSIDGTQKFIIDHYKTIDLIQSNENLGFGRGNNVGMLKAMHMKADYVFLLNQDGYVEPDTISTLVNFHIKNPDYGVLSPWQLNGEGTNTDKNFREFVLRKENCRQVDEGFFQVKFVMAAFWLISCSCIKVVGLFDPIFPHWGEDNDYLNRVIYHGFKVGLVKSSTGYHDRGTRIESEKNKIKLFYSSTLAKLTDINKPFIYSFFDLAYEYLKSSIKSLVRLKIGAFKAHQNGILFLISRTRAIFSSRKRNKELFLTPER